MKMKIRMRMKMKMRMRMRMRMKMKNFLKNKIVKDSNINELIEEPKEIKKS